MRSTRGTLVRQADGLHAKVYLIRPFAAIVGSANLSKDALSKDANARQTEAAIQVQDKTCVDEIAAWFDELWKHRSRAILKSDLEKAKRNWKPKASNHKGQIDIVGAIKKLPVRLRELAIKAARENLERSLARWRRQLTGMDPQKLTRKELHRITALLGEWVKRGHVYEPLKNRPLKQVRIGLSLLFDESKGIIDRLRLLKKHKYLDPMRIPSLSILLYWMNPYDYCPYDEKTVQFLKFHKLVRHGVSSASPKCYERWLVYSQELSLMWGLPSRGHLDRLITYWAREARLRHLQ
jgi:hypothetical protein